MKRFLILGMATVTACVSAWPCTDFGPTHNKYMFSVFRREKMKSPFADRLADYWKSYTGGTPAATEYWFGWDTETVLKAAKHKGDREMEVFAKLFDRYLKVAESVRQDSWEYPTKLQLQQRRATLLDVLAKAKAYRGQKLRGQYALLTMRANMMLGYDKNNLTYWTATASKLPASVWRDAMRNIYARALLKAGNRRKACDIYAEQGDMQSIKWLLQGFRNLAGIKSMYAADPDSPTLTYLVQDFVNNAQETVDLKAATDDDSNWLEEIGAKPVYSNEVKGFIAFADEVLKSNKIKNPCLWRTAQGMLYYLFGKDKEAMTALNEAVNMAGTERMKDNARAIRLLASARRNAPDAEYSAYLTGELDWLDRKINEEEGASSYYDNHYADVKDRVVFKGLIPLYQRNGRNYTAIMLCGMMRAFENGFNKTSSTDPNINYGAMNEYFGHLDGLTPDSLQTYFKYLKGNKTDGFERYVAERTYKDKDYYNDLIGTKLIACGRFDEAADYLEKVKTDFIDKQNISFYMSRRSFEVERWFNRQFIKNDDYIIYERDESWPKVNKNLKLEFCRAMSDLQHQYNLTREGAEKQRLAYKLATLTCQASYFGDCWFLTHYGKSVTDSARIGEADFMAETIKYLNESKLSDDMTLRYKSLYALALLPVDPWYTESYDKDYNTVITPRPDSRQYKALAELKKFARDYPQYTDRYTTKCDILKMFK